MSFRLMVRVALVVALVACGSSTEPNDPGGPGGGGSRLQPGTTHVLSLAQNDSVPVSGQVSFVSASGGEYAVFTTATGTGASIRLADSLTGSAIVNAFKSTAPGTSLDNSLAFRFTAAPGVVYVLSFEVFPDYNAQSAQLVEVDYRLDAVNTAPEGHAAAIAVGDTVDGQAIDPVADKDVFTLTGQPGREFVLFGQAQGSVAGARLYFLARDGQAGLTSTVATTGGPAHGGFIVATLPASGMATIEVVGLQSDPQLYRGAYRFWTWYVDHAPEHRAPAITPGAEITGESIDRAGDVDEFTFAGTAGTEVNIFLQGAPGIAATLIPPGGLPGTGFASTGADTSLYAHDTGRLALNSSGTWTVRVFGTQPDSLANVGAYRFLVYPIDRAPEHLPPSIALGDTVSGEVIDHPGDIDEYVINVAAGGYYNAYLQATDGNPATQFTLAAIDAGQAVLASTASSGADPTLAGQWTQRFQPLTTGLMTLRVMAGGFSAAHSTGSYRLIVDRINPAPEHAPATLAPGDSITESLDDDADLDVFTVTLATKTGITLGLQDTGGNPAGALFAGLTLNATALYGVTTVQPGPMLFNARELDPGTYTITVSGGASSRSRTSYKLALYPWKTGPETAADTFAIGDTVSERIAPFADNDQFTFYGREGQHVRVMLQGLSAGSGYFGAMVIRPGTFYPYISVSSPVSSPSLAAHQTLRYDLLSTGWYELHVSGGAPTDTGAYRFLIDTVTAVPEHVSATLALNDSVSGESMDFPDDIDEFFVNAPPGSEVGVMFNGPTPCCNYPSITVRDDAGDSALAYRPGQGFQFAGPFKVPASGRLRIDVIDYSPPFTPTYQGPYAFQVVAVRRAPESVSAAYTLGDTVRTEDIRPMGDIDEFQVTGTPGDTLRFYFGLRAAPSIGLALTPLILDGATGAILKGSTSSGVLGIGLLDQGILVVPASGSLVIRIASMGGVASDPITIASYQFLLRRGP